MDFEDVSNVLIWHKPSADVSHVSPKLRPIHQSRGQAHSHSFCINLGAAPQPPLEFGACALHVCVCVSPSLVSYLHAINKGRHRQGREPVVCSDSRGHGGLVSGGNED